MTFWKEIIDWVIEEVLIKLKDLLIEVINLFLMSVKVIGETIIGTVVEGVEDTGLLDWDKTAAMGFLDTVNYFVPLHESLGMFALLLSLWMSVWGYRLVKSWVSSVSGT